MYLDDIPKSTAETYVQLLQELRPDCPVRIVQQDPSLCALGFVEEVPCRLEVNLTLDEVEALYDEVIQMEVDAYNEEERILDMPYRKLNAEEKQRKRILEEYQARYAHFACLDPFLFYLMNHLE